MISPSRIDLLPSRDRSELVWLRMARPRRAWLASIAIIIAQLGCGVDEVDDDDKGGADCPVPLSWATISSPPGTYADRGLELSYGKLAPLPDPRHGSDRAQVEATIREPARLEQL